MARRTVLLPALVAGALLVACAAALLAAPEQARAAYPGQNGKIVYVEDTCGLSCMDLRAQGLGDAAPVAITDDGGWNVEPSYSYGGERIVFGDYSILAVPSSGGTPEVLLRPDPGGPDSFSHASLSPDGKTLLYEGYDRDARESSVYVAPASGGAPRLLAGGKYPEWSPDGARVSYSGAGGGIFTVPASGGAPSLVTDRGSAEHSWSPDGGRIAFVGRDSARGLNVLYTVPASGGGGPRPVHESADRLASPAYSPDGRYIAFSGTEPAVVGKYASEEIFVVPSDGGAPEQVTRTMYGAYQPDWQPLCPCPGPPPADATDPTVTRPRPAPGSEVRDRTPTVAATVRDGTGELSASDIKLRVDGARKAFSYDEATGRLSRTTGRLSYGKHRVRIEATDAAGNEAARGWTFRVVRGR